MAVPVEADFTMDLAMVALHLASLARRTRLGVAIVVLPELLVGARQVPREPIVRLGRHAPLAERLPQLPRRRLLPWKRRRMAAPATWRKFFSQAWTPRLRLVIYFHQQQLIW